MVTPEPESSDSPSAATLRNQMRDREVNQRQMAIAQLMESPREELLADLAERLDDPDPDVVLLTVIALMQLGANAIPSLVKGLEGHQPLAVRQMAASSLAQASPTGECALAPLRRCLNDEDATLRELAALGLSRGGEAAVRELRDALESPLRETHYGAIRALGWIGSAASSSLPALERFLADDDPRFRLAACVAWTDITAAPDKTIPTLLETSQHADAKLRELAAESLGELRTPQPAATGRLVELLDDPEPPVVAQAAISLGKSRSRAPEVLSALEKTLSHTDPLVRQNTVMALASWGPEARQVISAIEALQADQQADVAKVAAAAVEMIAP